MKDNKKKHLFQNIRFIIILTLVLLAIGVLGFYLFHEPNWVTAFYDAASILSAVGAADEPHTPEAKIFAGIYTLAIGLGYIFILSFVISSYLEQNE